MISLPPLDQKIAQYFQLERVYRQRRNMIALQIAREVIPDRINGLMNEDHEIEVLLDDLRRSITSSEWELYFSKQRLVNGDNCSKELFFNLPL